jgi:hypothetical protein
MGSEFFNKITYGKEDPTTHGTIVAASKMFIGQMQAIKPDRKPTYPAEHFGLRSDAYRSVIHQYLYQNTLSTEHGAFQHLPLLLGGGLKGAITPVEQTGGQADYLWDATPDTDSIDAVDSFTLRMGDDNQAWVSEYCMFERIRISGNVAQGADASPVKLEADFFGRQLQESTFLDQSETATIVGTITKTGNATVTVTAAGMSGSPKAISVSVAEFDTATAVAAKIRAALNLDAAVTAMFTIDSTVGITVKLTKIATTTIDATLNIAYTNGTCEGLTPDATSDDTSASSLTLPEMEPMNAKLARLYLNPSWATVGNTEMTDLLRTFDIEILTGLHPQFAGSAAKTFNHHYGGIVSVMGTFGLEGGSDAVDLLTAQQAGTFKVARLKILGSQIGTGQSYTFTLDFGGSFEDASPISGADRGDNLATCVLHGYLDKTAMKVLQASCITNSNAY